MSLRLARECSPWRTRWEWEVPRTGGTALLNARRQKFGGEAVRAGNIIIRQRGSRVLQGENVGRGKDDTLFALIDGTVQFRTRAGGRRQVSVVPMTE